MRRVLTFIMAGGKGRRLYPLTQDRAKPAVPFGGIYRIIDFTLSNCVNSGLRRIYLLTQYKSASLQTHIRLAWNIFSSELGEFIELLPAQQRIGDSWYKGTADAIFQNLYTFDFEKPDEALILCGDHIYKMDYNLMLDFHRQRGAELTVGVIEMESYAAVNLGVIVVDNVGNVAGFEEKPHQPKTIPGSPDKICASMGIYVFAADALKEELKENAKKPFSEHDFGKNIIPQMLKKKRKLSVFKFSGADSHWRDIGTIDAYYEANMDLIRVRPSFNLYDYKWPIRTYQEQFPPAKTQYAGDIDKERMGESIDSLISNGCVISGGRVERCILSPNVRINSYSKVEDSILMEGVEIGRYAKIRRAIIDKEVNIPQNMVIGYDRDEDKKKFFTTESGLVVVAKGTLLK